MSALWALALAFSISGFSQQPGGPALGPASAAAAQGAGSSDPACAADAARLCQAASGASGQVDCLRAHFSALSSACRAEHAAWNEADPTAKPPRGNGSATGAGAGGPGGGEGTCASDAQRLCTAEENRPGRRANCLRSHADDLSQGCRALHPEWGLPPQSLWGISADVNLKWKVVRPKWQAACGAALAKACPDAWSDEGRLWACVERHLQFMPQACSDFARTHDAWARRCPVEMVKFCAQASPDRQTACMLAHQADFSKGCRKFASSLQSAEQSK